MTLTDDLCSIVTPCTLLVVGSVAVAACNIRARYKTNWGTNGRYRLRDALVLVSSAENRATYAQIWLETRQQLKSDVLFVAGELGAAAATLSAAPLAHAYYYTGHALTAVVASAAMPATSAATRLVTVGAGVFIGYSLGRLAGSLAARTANWYGDDVDIANLRTWTNAGAAVGSAVGVAAVMVIAADTCLHPLAFVGTALGMAVAQCTAELLRKVVRTFDRCGDHTNH